MRPEVDLEALERYAARSRLILEEELHVKPDALRRDAGILDDVAMHYATHVGPRMNDELIGVISTSACRRVAKSDE